MKKSYLGWKSFLNKAIKFKIEHKLSYQEIGDAIGVHRSHVNRTFRGHTSPSVDTVLKMSDFMDIPLHVLFLPSEELTTQIFIEKVNQRLEELNWNADKLADLTGISLLRIADLLKGTNAMSVKERETISEVLDVDDDQMDSIEASRAKLLIQLLSDWRLSPDQIDTILNYIQEVK